MRGTNQTAAARRFARRAAAMAAAAAVTLGLGALAPQEAAASERWRFFDGRDGAMAQSCGGEGAFTGCATLQCGTDGKILFAIENLSRDAVVRPNGALVSAEYRDRVGWREARSGRGRSIVATDFNVNTALGAMRSNRELIAVIDRREERAFGAIRFTLRGSGQAINQLQDRCAQLARGPEPRRRDAVARSGRWEYFQRRRLAYAQSCGTFNGQEVCAVVYCRRGRGLEFGLDGLVERNNRPTRAGVIYVDDRPARQVEFTLERGVAGRGDQIWRANLPNSNRFSRRLKRANVLEIEIQRRSRPLIFSLNGSGRAISQVEARCEEVADRIQDRPVAAPPPRAPRPGRVVARYEDEILGRWGVDRFSCRGGGWRFDPASLRTPDGAECGRIQLSEVTGGPLAGGLMVRGVNCAGGARSKAGEARRFELLRRGDRMIMRISERRTIRAGNLTIQLGGEDRVRELIRCRR